MSGARRHEERKLQLKLRITIDGHTYEAEVEMIDAEESGLDDLPYAPISVEYQPPASAAVAADAQISEIPERESICRSPVTGLVIKVNVEPGQTVQPNDVILVLESMKMETQVTAHHAETVKTVLVAPGNSVKINQTLIEFE